MTLLKREEGYRKPHKSLKSHAKDLLLLHLMGGVVNVAVVVLLHLHLEMDLLLLLLLVATFLLHLLLLQ